MTGLFKAIVRGEGLRHRPVGLAVAEQRPVRATSGERDVTEVLFPISLYPLLLGIAHKRGDVGCDLSGVRMSEPAGARLGTIRLARWGAVQHGDGWIELFQPTGSAVHILSAPYRARRYAAAWRRVQVNARQPHAFHMDFRDLRALNVFYMMPRPVYLVTAIHEDRSNIFPMDLVGPLGANLFLLALRATSPAIELMRRGGRISLSAMPARFREIVYRLGAHHSKLSIDWDTLELETVASPCFGFPVPKDALGVRELVVRQTETIGSHILFVAEIADSTTASGEAQLCHVSDMYARWRAARGTPFVDA